MALVLLFAFAKRAMAQEEYPGGYTLIPLEPGPVRLLSMTADVNLRDDGQQAIVDVLAVYRVHNRDEGAAHTLRLAFPGYGVEAPAPTNVSLNAEGVDFAITPGKTQWWVAEAIIPAGGRTSLALTYSVPLGAEHFLRFRYPLDITAKAWPDKLESARFTLTFAEPPNPQSWLSLTPENYKLTAESITWSFDARDPDAAIDFTFMRPTVWARLRAGRQQVAAPGAPASASLELGKIYIELAASGDRAVFDRFFPLAVAAFTQAQSLNPQDAAAYRALESLYRQRAQWSDPPDPTYLALAVDQLATALENGVRDPDMSRAVAEEYATLIARARAAGDFDAANTHLHRLESLAGQSKTPVTSARLDEERRQLAIDWATSVLADQGPALARQVLVDAFGSAAVQIPGGRTARLSSLLIETDTRPGLRTYKFTAALRAQDDPFAQTLAAALAATDVATVTLESSQPMIVRVEAPFAGAADLQQRLQRLRSAVPPEPEWAGVRAALQPLDLSWSRVDERWRVQEQYGERQSLMSVSADLGLQAQTLEQATTDLDASDRLQMLLSQIWKAEADVWRRLGENTRARYTLHLYPHPGPELVRTWSLGAGEEVEMAGSATQYQIKPIAAAGGGVYFLFMLITAVLMWRRGRRK